MVILQNEQLEIRINNMGAELTRIFHKEFEIDYLWNGDGRYWGRQAPTLFPIVGTLKDNQYQFHGKVYTLLRHGFAREQLFTLTDANKLSASFELKANTETFSRYPFDFSLLIHYKLHLNKLAIIYKVTNTANDEILFSIGGHPAFNVPLEKNLSYTDYYLEFDQAETVSRWPLKHNLIETISRPFLKSERIINLKHQLFTNDAIVMKHLMSKSVSLKSRASTHGLSVRIDEFPFLGIWAAPEAPFVCIEPWQGLADNVSSSQKLEEKEGIIALSPADHWEKSWDITLF